MKNLLPVSILSFLLIGCTTTIDQSSKITETHYTNGIVVIEREAISKIVAAGEAKSVADKLRVSQSAKGTMTLGAEGVDSESTSVSVVELIKTLEALGKAFAK